MSLSDLVFATESERVKAVRFFNSQFVDPTNFLDPDRPKRSHHQSYQDLLLVSLYSGQTELYGIDDSPQRFTLLRQFAASPSSSKSNSLNQTHRQPCRSACFILDPNDSNDNDDMVFWAALASDDGRVYIHEIDLKRNESHDFQVEVVEICHGIIVRCVIRHPLKKGFFASTDEGLVYMYIYDDDTNLWKLEKFHSKHFLITMSIAVAPIGPQKILRVASVSQDLTAVVWMPEKDTFKTLINGHVGGLNCVAFHPNPSHPLLLTGADDNQVILWNYQTESVLKSFTPFSDCLTSVGFSLNHKLIVCGSEDGFLRAFKLDNFKTAFEFKPKDSEFRKSRLLGRLWAIDESSLGIIALGYDNGLHVYKFDKSPMIYDISSDGMSKKFVFCDQQNINVIQFPTSDTDQKIDSESLNSLKVKKIGVSDNQDISDVKISPNGKYIVLNFSDSTFSCQTTLAFRNQCMGKSNVLPVFSNDSELLFTSHNDSLIVYSNSFKSLNEVILHFEPESIFGGPIIAVTCGSDPTYAGTLFFTSEHHPQLIATIQLKATKLLWNYDGTLVLVIGENKSILAEFDPSKLSSADLKKSRPFRILYRFNFRIKSAIFATKYLLYINEGNNLECLFQIDSESTFEKTTLLSYIDGDILLTIGEQHLVTVFSGTKNKPTFKSYSIDFSILDFKKFVLSSDYEQAKKIFFTLDLPKQEEAITFLESKSKFDLAYEITTNKFRKASLAIRLGKYHEAMDMPLSRMQSDQLLRSVLKENKIDLLKEIVQSSANNKDLSIKLLFILSDIANNKEDAKDKLQDFIKICEEQKNNLQLLMISAFYSGDKYRVLQYLNSEELYAEGVIFANHFCRDQLNGELSLHHDNLHQRGHLKASERLIIKDEQSID